MAATSQIMDAQTAMARCKTQLVFNQPFFGVFALDTPFIGDDTIPTMCTNGEYIKWNPDKLMEWDEAERQFVVCHEIMHIALHHCVEISDIDGEPVDHKLLNVSMDYVINAQLIDAGMRMPKGGLFDAKYRGMTWLQVYRILKKEQPDHPEQPWGGDVGVPQDGDGKPLQGEAEKQHAAEIDIKVSKAAQAAEARGVGDLPAGIKEIVQKLRETKVNFEDVLLRFMCGDNPDDYTFTRPNKKAWYQGGLLLPTISNDGIGDIAILFDSSGSMQTSELEQGFSEIKSLVEEYTPRSVTVVQFDADVQKVDTFEDGEFIDKIEFTGRGGTRVEPAFKYLDQAGIDHDQIIVFSDMGIFDYPDIHPEAPTLWVSTSSRFSPPPFGEVTVIEVGA